MKYITLLAVCAALTCAARVYPGSVGAADTSMLAFQAAGKVIVLYSLESHARRYE
ncbi:MAG TPA: hypothetical protein P5287_01665 [bacterium]|nr:hypothetical protein [bacterium]